MQNSGENIQNKQNIHSHSKPFGSGLPLSATLIKENLKLHWYVPVLAFLIYFAGGILPALMYRVKPAVTAGQENVLYSLSSNLVENALRNWNVPFALLLLILPLVAAVIMMNFMHKPAKAMALHSQPFSRGKIYTSHIFTGWLMLLFPVVLTALCFLPLALYAQVSLSSVFRWGFITLASLSYFYSIYVVAGSITGTSTMQILVSGVFFGIVPLSIFLINAYCGEFLCGYSSMPDVLSDLMIDSNPLLSMISNYGRNGSLLLNLIYLIAAIILLALGSIFYRRGKLERVGDSMMYPALEELITWIVCFVGMSAGGFFFYLIGSKRSMLMTGIFIGGVLTFIIAKIVLRRSIKIFTPRAVKSLAIFLILALLFCGVTVYDMTGYSKRIPSQSKVQSVAPVTYYLIDDIITYSSYTENGEQLVNYRTDLTDEEVIQKTLALHQYIIDNQLYMGGTSQSTADYGDIIEYGTSEINNIASAWYMQFSYTLKGGSTLRRAFEVNADDTVYNMLKEICDLPAYRESKKLSNCIAAKNMYAFQFYIYDDTISESALSLFINDEEEMEKVVTAIEADQESRTFTNPDQATETFDNLYIDGNLLMKDNSGKNTGDAGAYIRVLPNDENTISLLCDLLEEKGYTDYAENLKAYRN